VSAFEPALDSGDVACVLLKSNAESQADNVLGRSLCESAQSRSIAFLIENDLATAQAVGADGVHLTDGEEAYKAARETLGSNAIIGVGCELERHTALMVAELGADYVAFSRQYGKPDGDEDETWRDIIDWWAKVVEVPLVAMDLSSPEEARIIAGLGADFAAPAQDIWSPAGSAAETLTAYARAITLAQGAP